VRRRVSQAQMAHTFQQQRYACGMCAGCLTKRGCLVATWQQQQVRVPRRQIAALV
jgi:hypothetical protein